MRRLHIFPTMRTPHDTPKNGIACGIAASASKAINKGYRPKIGYVASRVKVGTLGIYLVLYRPWAIDVRLDISGVDLANLVAPNVDP